LLVAASDEQKERWLPPLARGDHLGCWALTEPSSGSDAAAVQSRARCDGDAYVISGTKQFITNGGLAGFAVVLAATGERTLAAFEMIQWKLAKARTELDAARLLVHRAAALADAGRPFSNAASKAKLYASEAATRAADASLQVLGGYGYLRDFAVERHLRDARLMEIGEGTSEVQRIVIARDLLRAS